MEPDYPTHSTTLFEVFCDMLFYAIWNVIGVSSFEILACLFNNMNVIRATGLGLWFPELMNRISHSKDLSNALRICDMMTAKSIQVNETISIPKVGRNN